jgi:methyl-accepting chemotaxis protein
MMPKLSLNFSWKQKLSIVIAITLIGLLFVAGSAFVGLNSVNKGFEKQNLAVGYKQNSLSLTNNLLKLEAYALKLTGDNKAGFNEGLETLSSIAAEMQNLSVDLNNPELSAYSDKLAQLTTDYASKRKEWLDNRSVLGFTPAEGKLKNLYGSLTDLEKVSFSMIEEPIASLVSGQRKYMITKDKENEDAMSDSLVQLEQTALKLNWDTNVVGKTIQKYRTDFDVVSALITTESNIITVLVPLAEELSETVNRQNTFLEETVIQQVAREADEASKAALKIISAAAIVVGVVIFISLGSIARQLNIQLRHMQTFLKKVAEGDFSEQLTTNNNSKDEFTQLRTASNHMVHDISDVISKVVDGNISLLSIRQELEKAVEQLAITSEEVERKTQQSTVATQQISLAVNDVAKRSVGVSETAQTASKSTKTGGKVIGDCVNSMVNIVDLIEKTHEEVTNLAQSSTKMLGIIDVINGLADQTNLLALNAAIESARAGEAGRGFSVVADEVRALAQKTVSATSSIGDIIKSFNDQSKRMGTLMDEGIKLASSGQENANNAMHSIESIEESIQKVAAEMGQVVVAVEEISYNTNDIATQVEHICEQGERTKETRLTMEEHTHELSSQATALGKLTSRFKLSTD